MDIVVIGLDLNMRSRTPAKIYLKAIISLLSSSIFIEDCAYCDFQKELESNEQLRAASKEEKEETKLEIKKHTLNRLQLLRKKLLGSLTIILSAIIVGVLCISILKRSSLKPMLTASRVFILLSMTFFSWATLGRLGWAGQSCKGDTVFEDLDELIFRGLYWLGALFGLLGVAL